MKASNSLLIASSSAARLAEFLIEFANFVLSVPALFHLGLKVVAGLTKAVLDPAPNSAERGDNYRP